MGEAALLWPEGFPTVQQIGAGYYEDAERFFGISAKESAHLFSPGEQDTEKYRGKWLCMYATRYEVAANIRAFLEVKRQQEQERA